MNKLAALILLGGIFCASAQEKLVQFPSGPASWAVDFKKIGDPRANPASTDEPKVPELKRLEVAQTHDARRGRTRWSTGQSREVWSLPNLNLVVAEQPNGQPTVSRNTMLFGIPFAESDFAWMNGTVKTNDTPVILDGIACNHYKGVITMASPSPNSPPETIPCEAWIDAKTLLPVALLKDFMYGKFTFGAPPESLNMPENFRKHLDYYKLTMGM